MEPIGTWQAFRQYYSRINPGSSSQEASTAWREYKTRYSISSPPSSPTRSPKKASPSRKSPSRHSPVRTEMSRLTSATLLGLPQPLQEIIARHSGRSIAALSRVSRQTHTTTSKVIDDWCRDIPREGEILAYLRRRIELGESFTVAFYRPEKREVLNVRVSFPPTNPIYALGNVDYTRASLNDDGSIGYSQTTQSATRITEAILFDDALPGGMVDPETLLSVMTNRVSCVRNARRRDVEYGIEEIQRYLSAEVDAVISTLGAPDAPGYRIGTNILRLLAYLWRNQTKLSMLRNSIVEEAGLAGDELVTWLEGRNNDASWLLASRTTIPELQRVISKATESTQLSVSHTLRPPLSGEIVTYLKGEVDSGERVRVGFLREDTVYLLTSRDGLVRYAGYRVANQRIREVEVPATFLLSSMAMSRRFPGLVDPYTHHEVMLSLEGDNDWDETVYASLAADITRGYVLGAFRELVNRVVRDGDNLYAMKVNRIQDYMRGMQQFGGANQTLEEIREQYYDTLLRVRLRLYFWLGVGTDKYRASLLEEENLSDVANKSEMLIRLMSRVLFDLRKAYDSIE